MRFPRSAGILLHPTSLPGRFGIGELGAEARRFVDWLAEAGQTLWQILPLGPTGYGDSPYACFSAFAGNPLLLDACGEQYPWRSPGACMPRHPALATEGDLTTDELAAAPPFPDDHVDFGPVIAFKTALLGKAAGRFRENADAERRHAFERFCADNAAWLDDYALFRALKDAHGGAVWSTWGRPLAAREPAALDAARRHHADAIFAHQYVQWQFARQWGDLKAYAGAKGIRIVGDIPIFVAFDSADVWQHPELFHLDDAFQPTAVAGVPPDYFSKTGQLWGNPLYRWDVMADRGFAWWVDRVRHTLRSVDIIRLDHFRGFAACWEVPAGEATAENGRWVDGPGAPFFEALAHELGELPLVAEDLGLITDDVLALRDQFDLPGMIVLQFAWTSDATNAYLPHNHVSNAVVYTGTHDNDTTAAWYATRETDEKQAVDTYLGTAGEPVHWALIRTAYRSVADLAVVPLQDVLGLGPAARMNTPGVAARNWAWRARAQSFDEDAARRLAGLAATYGRLPIEPEARD
ncbi:4-alpha-glucanotransferase [bacterium]|nr:4-alpha-glucanotransferase [bacterium]